MVDSNVSPVMSANEANEGSLDLHSYVEAKRLFRSVLRVHRATLMQIREFWALMLRDQAHAAHIEKVRGLGTWQS